MGKKRPRTHSRFGHSAMYVCEKRRRRSLWENYWPKEFHEPCSSPQFVSHIGEENVKNALYSILCVLSMGLWTSSSTIACISVWFGVPAAPQLRRGHRGLFAKLASCRCLGLCASPPLALPVASRQPHISSQQSFKETPSSGVKASVVTATRVSDSAVWDDLIVTPAQLKVSPEEDGRNRAKV